MSVSGSITSLPEGKYLKTSFCKKSLLEAEVIGKANELCIRIIVHEALKVAGLSYVPGAGLTSHMQLPLPHAILGNS